MFHPFILIEFHRYYFDFVHLDQQMKAKRMKRIYPDHKLLGRNPLGWILTLSHFLQCQSHKSLNSIYQLRVPVKISFH